MGLLATIAGRFSCYLLGSTQVMREPPLPVVQMPGCLIGAGQQPISTLPPAEVCVKNYEVRRFKRQQAVLVTLEWTSDSSNPAAGLSAQLVFVAVRGFSRSHITRPVLKGIRMPVLTSWPAKLQRQLGWVAIRLNSNETKVAPQVAVNEREPYCA